MLIGQGKRKRALLKSSGGFVEFIAEILNLQSVNFGKVLPMRKGMYAIRQPKGKKKAKRNKAFGIYFCVNKVIH
ncbi:hypothetical protein AB2S62_22165 [Vibrio sp. NTOU-M3]|uniref:hypothetical protein n=1 Tax=Vibrio sp. NTOU-M3 TaxID=3234954 RepID=UPI0035A93F7C